MELGSGGTGGRGAVDDAPGGGEVVSEVPQDANFNTESVRRPVIGLNGLVLRCRRADLASLFEEGGNIALHTKAVAAAASRSAHKLKTIIVIFL